MDRLDELAIFVRIVEESSLVRAASRLRRSPPAVTRALASLEARLGVRLIHGVPTESLAMANATSRAASPSAPAPSNTSKYPECAS